MRITGFWRATFAVLSALALCMSAAHARPAREPAIWTIEKPNGRTITLFGSVHLLPDGDDWRTKALDAAYEGADVIVLETDMETIRSAEMQRYLRAHAFNEDGVTLSSLLTNEQRALLARGLGRAGLSLSDVDSFRPWFAALQLSVANALAQGFSPDQGVDKRLSDLARRDDKAFDYLESPREQLDLFIELPEDEQLNFLLLGARELIDRPDELKQLVAAWRKGDVAQIDELMNRGLEDAPRVARALLRDRNARWVKVIREFYMKDRNSYLIVVGAGHLAGGEGVPQMLRDAGVEVVGP